MAFVPTPDQIAVDIANAAVLGPPPGPDATVTFRGYLSEPSQAGVYRLYIRPSFDVWLELTAADMLAQVPGSTETYGESLVWVRRDATITRGGSAFAVELASEQVDPTDPAAGYYPKR